MREKSVTSLQRRRFITGGAVLFSAWKFPAGAAQQQTSCAATGLQLPDPGPPNTRRQISNYNNYYEFSTNKEAVAILADALTITPWHLRVEGLVQRPLQLDAFTLTDHFNVVQRTYSMRCVEGWSKLVPWQGIPLCEILRAAQPKQQAAFVEFECLHRPAEMIGQRRPGATVALHRGAAHG